MHGIAKCIDAEVIQEARGGCSACLARSLQNFARLVAAFRRESKGDPPLIPGASKEDHLERPFSRGLDMDKDEEDRAKEILGHLVPAPLSSKLQEGATHPTCHGACAALGRRTPLFKET